MCDRNTYLFLSGHNLEDIHRLDDGGLRYTMQNLSYSLNKRKRWLLPEIIEQRIGQYPQKMFERRLSGNQQGRSNTLRRSHVYYECVRDVEISVTILAIYCINPMEHDHYLPS